MTDPVIIGDATLDGADRLSATPRRKPWCKSPIKAVVACRGCDWSWKPTTGFGHERCPKCGKIRCVRDRNYGGKKNLAAINQWRAHKPGYSTEWTRRYRRRALLLVGRGELRCIRCGCDRVEFLEINHKEGAGGKEHREMGKSFYSAIAKMRRDVDDLELLCRPCNAIHYLEMKHGPLPFSIRWGAQQ